MNVEYKKITDQKDRCIHVFDNLFTMQERHKAYCYIINSSFKIGFGDNRVIENEHHKYFCCDLTYEEYLQFNLIENIRNKNKIINDILLNYNNNRTIINLTMSSECHFIHNHSKNTKIILYYPNMNWDENWQGQTFFYDDNLRDVLFCSPYIPGRLVIFDGDIPHTIGVPTNNAPFFRFTVSAFFNYNN